MTPLSINSCNPRRRIHGRVTTKPPSAPATKIVTIARPTSQYGRSWIHAIGVVVHAIGVVVVERRPAVERAARVSERVTPGRPWALRPTQRRPSQHGRLGQPRQRGGLFAQRIDRHILVGRSDEPQPGQAPVHPPHHAVDVGVGRWRRGMDDERVVRLADEDPVVHERVEVDVEIERSAEPLDARHHARLDDPRPDDEFVLNRPNPLSRAETPTLSPSSSTPRPHPPCSGSARTDPASSPAATHTPPTRRSAARSPCRRAWRSRRAPCPCRPRRPKKSRTAHPPPSALASSE